jgi:hypothetical protein
MARRFNDKPLGSIAWAYEHIPEDDVEDLVARSRNMYTYFESVAQLPQAEDLNTLNSWFSAASADKEHASTPDKPERSGWCRAAEQIGMVVLLSGAVYVAGTIVYKSVVFGPGYTTPARQPQLEILGHSYPDGFPHVMAESQLDPASIALPNIENTYKIA